MATLIAHKAVLCVINRQRKCRNSRLLRWLEAMLKAFRSGLGGNDALIGAEDGDWT